MGWTSKILPWASKNYNRLYKERIFLNISGRLNKILVWNAVKISTIHLKKKDINFSQRVVRSWPNNTSYDCPRSSEATMKNMGKWIIWMTLDKNNGLKKKEKHVPYIWDNIHSTLVPQTYRIIGHYGYRVFRAVCGLFKGFHLEASMHGTPHSLKVGAVGASHQPIVHNARDGGVQGT